MSRLSVEIPHSYVVDPIDPKFIILQYLKKQIFGKKKEKKEKKFVSMKLQTFFYDMKILLIALLDVER